MRGWPFTHALLVGAMLLGLALRSAYAAESDGVKLTFLDAQGAARTIEGKVAVEAADGGLMLLSPDGRLWTVTPKQIVSRAAAGAPFAYWTPDELGRSLLEELGRGFEIVRTKHYVIATATDPAYAMACGELLERLVDRFLRQWKAAGVEVAEPDHPLIAVICGNERQFKQHALDDAGRFAEISDGYYSIRTNRIVLHDLSAVAQRRAPSASKKKQAAAFNVATVIHEATHQLAFNTGMNVRYADNPLWLTEGMAMCAETWRPDKPDEEKIAGGVNRLRQDQFVSFLRRRRKSESLRELVSRDARFIQTSSAKEAYAEAWALSHFLMSTRPREYATYLSRLQSKKPLMWDNSGRRLDEFRAAFGDDLAALDREFVAFCKALPAAR